ncbi:thymidylate synthase [uncultured Sphingomonas sp.]|uniref:thymidylate synthase n=1 Tax=uncultured Sphingomonas sp. TaxID=158754 RepID=UPI0025E9A457|nr:thymidylate synthase [uncultured Sphingomonas sp.]
MTSYRNISVATVNIVGELLSTGSTISVRGLQTREVLARHTRLERPLERYLFVPERNDDVFAQVAETMWVLAGRDDVAWLERYLPRAREFSDNGETWRAAYGPRLRNWNGRDQIAETVRLLTEDPTSRRAVMSLFDPDRDFIESKDVPCTNWLGWIIRDKRLEMSVTLRSNDVIWGFSGVNSFEWSILQEMLAFWLGVEVGPANYFAMSLHLYDRHVDRAGRIVQAARRPSPYDFRIKRHPFATPWVDFDAKLARWFALEQAVSTNPGQPIGSFGSVGDPLLDAALTLVHLRWASEVWDDRRLVRELGQLPAADHVVAAYRHLGRRRPDVLECIPQEEVAAFFSAAGTAAEISDEDVRGAIKRLHAEKNRAYAGAWKRRGELVSIQPNIARKVDRLETLVATRTLMAGETALDTAIDLLIYAEKYRLFLAEGMTPGTLIPTDALEPLSDHDANLDLLIDRLGLTPSGREVEIIVREIVEAFDHSWRRAESGALPEDRFETATLVSTLAGELVALLAGRDREAVARFLRHEARK